MSEVNKNTQQVPVPAFGEKLVGKSFNPSADPRVDRLKALFAEAADIVNGHNANPKETESGRTVMDPEDAYLNSTFKGGAIRRILTAQMWAVKHITNK